jgi:hypothetical protein
MVRRDDDAVGERSGERARLSDARDVEDDACEGEGEGEDMRGKVDSFCRVCRAEADAREQKVTVKNTKKNSIDKNKTQGTRTYHTISLSEAFCSPESE